MRFSLPVSETQLDALIDPSRSRILYILNDLVEVFLRRRVGRWRLTQPGRHDSRLLCRFCPAWVAQKKKRGGLKKGVTAGRLHRSKLRSVQSKRLFPAPSTPSVLVFDSEVRFEKCSAILRTQTSVSCSVIEFESRTTKKPLFFKWTSQDFRLISTSAIKSCYCSLMVNCQICCCR